MTTTDRAAVLVAAAITQQGQGASPAAVFEAAYRLLPVVTDFAELLAQLEDPDCRHYIVELTSVGKATAKDGHEINKARLHWVPREDGKFEDIGYIDTDWLNRSRAARLVAKIAQQVLDDDQRSKRVVIHQLNEPDRDGVVSQGYRRVIAITPTWGPPSIARDRAEPEERYESRPAGSPLRPGEEPF